AVLLTACSGSRPAVSSAPPTEKTSTASVERKERPRRFNELFLESVRQKELEHTDAQFELLEAALKLRPDAPEALYEMALIKLTSTVYSDTLSKAEGDSMLQLAVRLEPENIAYKKTLGTYLANMTRFREAIALYEEIAETESGPENLSMLIWLYKQNGDYTGVIRTIERLEQKEGKSEQLSLEKFQTYIAMNDNSHAFRTIEELCAEYPLDLRYRVLLGDLYDQYGFHERALDTYLDVLATEPDNSYAQISLLAYYKAAQADSLYLNLLKRVVLNPHTESDARVEALRTYTIDNIQNEGDSEPVLALLDSALAMPRQAAEVARLKVYYSLQKGLPEEEVILALEQDLKAEPDYTPARMSLLKMRLERDQLPEALQLCRDGLLYEPSEVIFYYYEASILYKLGDDDGAIKVLQRGVLRIDASADPETASDLHGLLGDILHSKKIYEEAYAAYDRALELNPANLLCLNNYAYFLSQQGKNLERALEMSKKTIEAEPENATYLDTYAWILYVSKKYDEAKTFIDRTLQHTELSSDNYTLFDHAGDIYFHVGERAQAVDFWKKALSVCPDAADARKLRQKIRNRRP
ncbi:MAG: tetratricopeptide repeat protein, partial [Alloprevotella sp.]